MAGTNKNAKSSNLKKIPGQPGFYTFVTIERNPRKEKAFIAKVLKDARKLERERLARMDLLSHIPG